MRISNLAMIAATAWKAHANYSPRDVFEAEPNLVWKRSNVKSWDNLIVRSLDSNSVSGSTSIRPSSPEPNKNVFGRDAKLHTRAPRRRRTVATTNSRATLLADEEHAVLFIFGRGITGGIIRPDHHATDITAITSQVGVVEEAASDRAAQNHPRGHHGDGNVPLRGVLFGRTNDQIDGIRRSVRAGVLGPIRIDRHRFPMIHRSTGHWLYDADLHSRSVRQVWEGPEANVSDVTESSSDSGSEAELHKAMSARVRPKFAQGGKWAESSSDSGSEGELHKAMEARVRPKFAQGGKRADGGLGGGIGKRAR